MTTQRTKNIIFLLLVTMLPTMVWSRNVTIVQMRTENQINPLGIGTQTPHFSWQITSDKANVSQISYQILVASSQEKLAQNIGDLWDSGKRESNQQLWIPYQGKRLFSNNLAYWKVRITTNRGQSEWTVPQMFCIGLLNESKWKGTWIGLEELQEGEHKGLHTRLRARYIRKEFETKGAIKRAMAYIAGLGIYEFYVNGQRLGDNHVLQPVPSDYRKTIYYNTYDITHLIDSKNAIAIKLGNGRFFPMRLNKSYKTPFFGFPKCRINIKIEYTNGKTETWATDNTWKLSSDGPIRSNNEYDGEEYDAQKELAGWTFPGFNDNTWQNAERCAVPEGTLTAQPMEGMTEIAFGHPKTITVRHDTLLLDFGQNMAGWIGFKVRNKHQGDTICVKYAEKLTSNGNLYLDNLRDALSEDTYICNGKENGKEWKPVFSYHGFRYAVIIGMPHAKSEDFTAYTVSDEMQTIGKIETSDTILNKVLHNAWWGIYSNYKGMPVDCPQRNERQPWLGDRTVGSLGESFLFNNERLYSKWMKDICDAQRSDGNIPDVAPTFWNYYTDDVTWPAALPFTCDMLYQQYGNIQPIIDSYASIKKWLLHIIEEYSDNHGIITKDKYGDWCLPPEQLELIHSQDPKRKTDGKLIATAYTIRCLQLAEKFAKLQGLETDASTWNSKYKSMIAAFNQQFLTCKRGTSLRPGHVLYPDSVFYGNNTTTANLLPLAFGIAPKNLRHELIKQVVQKICIESKEHVNCGVIGISWLLRGLSDNGFADVAYLLATQSTYPSWGYMAENGATTIWELWNGDKANPKMNSGNHVMLLGDLLTWCYQYLAGIRQSEQSAAYKHISLKPDFSIQDCSYVKGEYTTPYGTVKSHWKKTLQHLDWDISIPCNTTAEIHFPDSTVKLIGSGNYHYSVEIPTTDTAIIKDDFLYESCDFPSAHASTITELKNGDLVAAYFGGTFERNPDVCIWVSRKPKDAKIWEKPILAADGVFQIGTKEAQYAGLSGINEQTTSADKGPIKDGHQRFGIPTNYQYNYLSKTANIQLADNLKRKSCWNPVLYTMPNGEIWLFFKIGASVGDWTGWIVKSQDGGKTWGKREPLPKGFLGPIKNKPELINNRLLCGSSTENDGWRFHMEILDLGKQQWQYVGPVDAEMLPRTDDVEPTTKDMNFPIYKDGQQAKYIYSIQPSILKLKDGRLQVLMRTHNAKLATSFSDDGGDTWSKITLSEVENNQSGTDAVTLRDGRHVLIYNNFETLPSTPKGPRTPLSIAISEDGQHWRHLLTLEDSPINQYSYPAIIEGQDGTLHCTYTWRRKRVVYKRIDLKALDQKK